MHIFYINVTKGILIKLVQSTGLLVLLSLNFFPTSSLLTSTAYADTYKPHIKHPVKKIKNKDKKAPVKQGVSGVRKKKIYTAHDKKSGQKKKTKEQLLKNITNNSLKGKPINLPSLKKLKIDMGHVLSGHRQGGSRVSPQKSVFPNKMSPNKIKQSIKEAYRKAKIIKSQGDRRLLRGKDKTGREIEMWLNTKTKTLETAYPKEF